MSQEVPMTPTKITSDKLFLDNLQTMSAKSFIANKINIITKVPVCYSYNSQAKIIHNILPPTHTENNKSLF